MDGGRAAAGTHISSLSDDILRRIFLRLPSLATLVRAACACRAWRRSVASCPDFRRVFRVLHPAPPLLGLFFDTSARRVPPCIPTFVPVRPRDSDLAAAVRGGDFFLTSLHERPGDDVILDCRGGYVLLATVGSVCRDGTFVVLNPLMRQSKHVSCDPYFGYHYHYYSLPKARLVCSDEDATSFRVVLLAYEGNNGRSRVWASVFSSETGEWSVLPSVNVPERSDPDPNPYSVSYKCWDEIEVLDEGRMQANGFLYWVYRYWTDKDLRYLISLNTATLEFSFGEMPPQCLGSHCTYDAGETKDGSTCIVYSDGINIGVLMQRRGDDGVERWVLDRVLNLQSISSGPGRNELFVFAVRNGYAYLSTSSMYNDPPAHCWFMSLCLETMKFERLLRRAYECAAHPYIMVWPPCLTGNNGPFALEDAP